MAFNWTKNNISSPTSSNQVNLKTNTPKFDWSRGQTTPKSTLGNVLDSSIGKGMVGVGNFVTDVGKDAFNTLLVNPAARATEAVTRTLAPNSLAAKGYNTMADAGQSQHLLGVDVAPQKAFGQGGATQIAGQGLNAASWLIGAGGAKTVVKGLTKTAELAAKKTFAEMAVKQIPELAKLGFKIGATSTFGKQLTDKAETGKPIDWNQAVKDIGVSTVITPLIGLGIAKLFGTKASKILEARQALRDSEIVANRVKAEAMPIGTKFDNVSKPSAGNILDNTFNPKVETNTSNINTKGGAFVPTPKAVPSNPLENRAILNANKNDFIGQEIQGLQRQGKKIPSNLQKQASKVWDKMHPVADTSKVGIPLKSGVKNKGLNETPVLETPSTGTKTEVPTQPQVDTNTPEFKQKVKENFDILNEQRPEEFNAKTNELYANKYALDRTANPTFVERVALGLEIHPEGAAFTDAYNALLSNEASKTGNVDLIDKLSDVKIGSISGQKLQANSMRVQDGAVDIIRKIKDGKFNELPNAVKNIFNKETTVGKNILSKELNSTPIVTRDVISKIARSLICP